MTQQPHYNEEIDFRDLLRSPRKLFGFSYIFFFTLFVAVGILYAWNLNDIGKNGAVPLVLEDSSAFVRDIPMQSASVLPPVNVNQVVVPNADLLSRGRELFKANCSSCHGDNGMGDGPAGLLLNPKPRNFHQATGWTNGAKISAIYQTLQEGIIRNGMASYSYLPPADRFALIHVVRSFHPAPPADTPEEIAGLETTYQLSKGSVVQAQIPIRDAMRRIAGESSPGNDSMMSRLASTKGEAQDPGARLFALYVKSPERLLTACRSKREVIASTEGFIQIVTANPAALGVRASVAALDAQHWSSLHQFVLAEVQ